MDKLLNELVVGCTSTWHYCGSCPLKILFSHVRASSMAVELKKNILYKTSPVESEDQVTAFLPNKNKSFVRIDALLLIQNSFPDQEGKF